MLYHLAFLLPFLCLTAAETCKFSHEDCDEETLVCSAELRQQGKTVVFDNLKNCMYQLVELGRTRDCCAEYVKETRTTDPAWKGDLPGLTRYPTVAPVEKVEGNVEDCPTYDTSTNCLRYASCAWRYWTRECVANSIAEGVCYEDNRDCKNELAFCKKKEEDAGRTPKLKNLEACVLMNEQNPCCKAYTEKYLSLAGLKRKFRPDRYDMTNCEHFARNTSCKRQPACRWNKEGKYCHPQKDVVAIDTRFDPANACGFKGFKITLVSEKKALKFTGWAVRKRGVTNSCDCARLCREYENWSWRSKAKKCGCTNDKIQRVNLHSNWFSSTTKKSRKIKDCLKKEGDCN